MADWAAANGVKKVVSMVSDYAPGADAEKSFKDEFTKKGGQVLDSIRFPLANPDFAPFLQRAADQKPDAIFVFVPSGQGGIFVKQFVERGLDKAGIKIIGPGDVTDDDLLNGMGDAVVGTHHRAFLFRRSRFAGQQGVRCRVQTGQWRPAAELHGGVGL
jgi:branched-chain amino acid transport system substrate-binding protein